MLWRKARERASAPVHLHVRTTLVERLIADDTDRYLGRKARDGAAARPNNQIGAFARIRKRMARGAVLLERRLSLRNRAGGVVFGLAAGGPRQHRGDTEQNDRQQHDASAVRRFKVVTVLGHFRSPSRTQG